MQTALAAAAGAIAECGQVPLWALPDAELVAALDEAHRLEQRLAAVKLALIREVDGRDLGPAHGASSTAVWLRDRLRMSVPAARRLRDLATTLEATPAVRDALAAGAVSLEQAHAIAAAVRDLPPEAGPQVVDQAATALVEQASRFDPTVLRRLGARILALVAPQVAEAAETRALDEQERRAFRRRRLTMSPDGAGGVRLRGQLSSEAAAVVAATLDPLCAPGRLADQHGPDRRSAEQRRADALVEVCRLALHSGQLPAHGGDRPQLVVTVGYDVLARSLGPGTLDNGTTLSPAVVRRLACDARILPVVLGGAGQPLGVSRERRLVTGPLRRALIARDRGCAFPGCDRPPRWCDGHHVVSWLDGGHTSLTNAVLLCGHHHRLIHHSDWTVRIAPDGHPEFQPPAWIDPTRAARRNVYHCRST